MLIPVPTWDWLSAEAGELGITVSEFIRRVLDEKRLGKKGR